MKRVVLVAGTNSWNPDERAPEWNEPGSPFVKFMQERGVSFVMPEGRVFTWSTELGGVGFGRSDLRVWHAAGLNLYGYVVPPLCPDRRIPPEETVILAHSHGLQVALFAFAHGLKGRLVSVGGPVRKDMEPIARAARKNISSWLHLHNDFKDLWQVAGALFDGHVGIVRRHPLADMNDAMPGGHSAVLCDPGRFPLWIERSWIFWLREASETLSQQPAA